MLVIAWTFYHVSVILIWSFCWFRTSALAMMDEMNQKTRSTSTLMPNMFYSQFNWRRCSYQFPGVQVTFLCHHVVKNPMLATSECCLKSFFAFSCVQLVVGAKICGFGILPDQTLFRKSWRLLKYKEDMKDIHPDHVYRRSFQIISNLVLSLFSSWCGIQNEGSTLHII